MKCRGCKYVFYMLDPWDNERIRIVCDSLGTATSIPAPGGWDETMPLPDGLKCAFDLGTKNPYCQGTVGKERRE